MKRLSTILVALILLAISPCFFCGEHGGIDVPTVNAMVITDNQHSESDCHSPKQQAPRSEINTCHDANHHIMVTENKVLNVTMDGVRLHSHFNNILPYHCNIVFRNTLNRSPPAFLLKEKKSPPPLTGIIIKKE